VAAVVDTRETTPAGLGSGIDVATAGVVDGEGGHDANIRQLADSLFSDYVFAFELTSVLLIVAVAGTVLMTRKLREPADDESGE
jgi:NADH-quinone oxidoreductase subunit J